MKTFQDYKHIIDDGDCADHGLILDKSKVVPCYSASIAISPVNVSSEDLHLALAKLGEEQGRRLAQNNFSI
jgi:hypothetical protein